LGNGLSWPFPLTSFILLLVVTLRYISIVLVVQSSWCREVVIVGGKGKSNPDYVTMPRGPNGLHYCITIVHRHEYRAYILGLENVVLVQNSVCL